MRLLRIDKHARYHLLLIAVLFLIIFVRAPRALLLPTLRVEDGHDVFAHFYQNRGLVEVLRFKGGYLPLLPNLIGYLSVRLPTRMIPYALTWIPLALTLIAHSVFFSKAYATYIPSSLLRFSICVFFSLVPFSQFHLLSLTDYSIWNALLLLVLLSIVRFPDRHRAPILVVYALLVWSHPLSIVVLPFIIYHFVEDRSNRFFYGLVILNLLAHQVVGVSSSAIPLEDVLTRLVKVPVWSVRYVAYVCGIISWGRNAIEHLRENMQTVVWIWTALVAATIGYHCKKRRRFRRLSVALGYYALSITMITNLVYGSRALREMDGSPRYFYVQAICLLTLTVTAIVYSVTPVIERIQGAKANRWLCAFPSQVPVLVMLAILFAALNLGNLDTYQPKNTTNGLIVRGFFRKLAAEERRLGSHRGIQLKAEKIDDWPIVIDTIPETRVVYHDGFLHNGAGRYAPGTQPWMDLLVSFDGSWYGPERASWDDIVAHPLPENYQWECVGGFGCHDNGEAWWLGSSTEGTARLVSSTGAVMAEQSLRIAFLDQDEGAG